MTDFIQLTTDFFTKPQYTIKRCSKSDLEYSKLFLLLFISTMSVHVADLLANKKYIPPHSIFFTSLSITIMTILCSYVLLALIIFGISLSRKKINSKKVLFFSLLSLTPSILSTPIQIIGSLTGNASILIASIAIILFQLYLLGTSISTILKLRTHHILIILFSPIIIIIGIFILFLLLFL